MTHLPAAPVTPWQFRFSPTLKGIYVLRYLLFSGGLAIGGAMLARNLFRSAPSLGLLIGLCAGLVAFRGQLRPFALPTLALGRDHLFFIARAKVDTVPWERLRRVAVDRGVVVVELQEPTAELRMRALEFALTPGGLSHLLQRYLEPSERRLLPSDAEVRQTFKA